MSVCNYTTQINGFDCIGDSRSTINQNFANLDNAVCALSSTGISVIDTSTIDMTFDPATRAIQASVNPLSIAVSAIANDAIETVKIKNANVTNSKLAFDGGSFGFKNKIINGAFNVWQRGTSFTSSNYFTADRFLVTRGGGGIGTGSTDITVERSMSFIPGYPFDTDSFTSSIKIQRNASTTNTATIKMMYVAESVDVMAMKGKDVTLSFFVKRGNDFTSTDLVSRICTGTGIDEGITSLHTGTWSSINIQTSPAILTALNWQRITQTVTVPANATEIGIVFEYTPPVGAAGADESLYITGVQLELGTAATPFEHRSQGYELSLCQRYFEKSYNQTQAPATNTGAQCLYNVISIAGPAFYNTSGSFSVSKFKSPVVTIYSPNGGGAAAGKFIDTGGSTYIVPSVDSNENSILKISASVSIPAGKIIQWHYTADAEIV